MAVKMALIACFLELVIGNSGVQVRSQSNHNCHSVMFVRPELFGYVSEDINTQLPAQKKYTIAGCVVGTNISYVGNGDLVSHVSVLHHHQHNCKIVNNSNLRIFVFAFVFLFHCKKHS